MAINEPLMLTPASEDQPPESWFGPGGCGSQQAAQVHSFCQQPAEVGHGGEMRDGHGDLAQDLRAGTRCFRAWTPPLQSPRGLFHPSEDAKPSGPLHCLGPFCPASQPCQACSRPWAGLLQATPLLGMPQEEFDSIIATVRAQTHRLGSLCPGSAVQTPSA